MNRGSPEWLKKAIADGTATVTGVASDHSPDSGKKVKLVTPSFTPRGTWTIAYHAVSEANKRQWQGRNRRAGMAWQAVRDAVLLSDLSIFAVNVLCKSPIHATFTKLGGRHMDVMENLPASMKGCADAVCYLLGIDDSSPLWLPVCKQEPGPLHGVRVELRV